MSEFRNRSIGLLLAAVCGVGLACQEELPVEEAPPLDTGWVDPEGASPWHCDDGLDNDLDGAIDCDDSDCAASPYCNENVDDGNCADGEDNDEDGDVDCEDSDCEDSEDCTEAGDEDAVEEECSDGEDNDEDGYVDCEDDDCASSEDCVEEKEQCDDDELEIDILGDSSPSVGDEWTVWLRCDGVTLIGTLVLRVDPPALAEIDQNQVTFRMSGSAEMTVQVGGYRASMDFTVSE